MESSKALKVLNPKSVWLPVILGLGLVAFMAYRDNQFTAESFALFSDFRLPFILIAFFVICIKDGLNGLRVNLISHSNIDFFPALRIVLLWEFAIAVTPPLVGAAAVLVFIIFKEGQTFGKALAYTLLLAILDNLFFLTASPLALWLSNGEVLPMNTTDSSFLEKGMTGVFWYSYTTIVLFTFFMLSALLFFPKTVRKLLSSLMKGKLLNRWESVVMKQSDEMVLASQVLKGQSLMYWAKLLFITYLIWIFKFVLVNVWVSGFIGFDWSNQALMIGRHLTMWIVMLVSPSPGNAGTAEIIFPLFFEEYAGRYSFLSSILWRLSTYYPYLIVGVLLIPKWWKK